MPVVSVLMSLLRRQLQCRRARGGRRTRSIFVALLDAGRCSRRRWTRRHRRGARARMAAATLRGVRPPARMSSQRARERPPPRPSRCVCPLPLTGAFEQHAPRQRACGLGPTGRSTGSTLSAGGSVSASRSSMSVCRSRAGSRAGSRRPPRCVGWRITATRATRARHGCRELAGALRRHVARRRLRTRSRSHRPRSRSPRSPPRRASCRRS